MQIFFEIKKKHIYTIYNIWQLQNALNSDTLEYPSSDYVHKLHEFENPLVFLPNANSHFQTENHYL